MLTKIGHYDIENEHDSHIVDLFLQDDNSFLFRMKTFAKKAKVFFTPGSVCAHYIIGSIVLEIFSRESRRGEGF